MWDWSIIAAIAAIYFAAGAVKGLIGFGLPIVAVGLTAAAIGFREAVALMLVPAFATNVWQAWAGPDLVALLRRLWSYLATTAIAIWLVGAILAAGDPAQLTFVLGTLMLVYSFLTLAGLDLPPPGRNEPWVAPLVGLANGTISGISGMFAIVTGPWLQTLRLGRDQTIQALGLIFSFATLVLAGSMSSRALLNAELGWMSVAALIPTFAGMAIGQVLRQRTSEPAFRRLFLGALALLGAYLMARSLFG